jgi:hypothetical protein
LDCIAFVNLDGPSQRRRKRGRAAQNAYRQRQINRTLELEVRVKSLEKALHGVSEAARELDHVLGLPPPRDASTLLPTHTVVAQVDCVAQSSYSIKRARDRLSEAVQQAVAECEPPTSGSPPMVNLHPSHSFPIGRY